MVEVDTGYENTVHRLQNIITSPNYPNYYDNRIDCSWNITSPIGSQLRLELLFFNLEDGPHCLNDYLQIIDERSDGKGKVIRICGSVEPKYIISSTNRSITLRFASNRNIVRKGFSIRYSLDSGIMFEILRHF